MSCRDTVYLPKYRAYWFVMMAALICPCIELDFHFIKDNLVSSRINLSTITNLYRNFIQIQSRVYLVTRLKYGIYIYLFIYFHYSGIGYCAVCVSYFVSFYYNTIMGWSLHFTINSFTSPLPWVSFHFFN